jgi:hypothetical protein
MSIEIPTDPVQDLIDKATFWRREIALFIVDEDAIIKEGMEDIPNQIVTAELAYESLESEPDPNKLRGIARQLDDLKRETHMRALRSLSPRKLQRMAERKTGKRLVV